MLLFKRVSLNGLDLFSGIGGISIALSKWVRPIAYCEIDRYAQAVLLSRMHKGEISYAPIWDDVRTLRGEMLPSVDIISGGFPCQDISVAGHGVGLEGKRSGLFFQILRISDELKPAFLFLENVPAIRTRGAERVGKELASRGYDCRWDVVPAAEVAAQFEGQRWFLAAANRQALREQPWRGYGEGGQGQTLNTSASEPWLTSWTSQGGFKPRVSRTGNGISFAVDRDRCLGNAVVPLQAREAFKRLMGLT